MERKWWTLVVVSTATFMLLLDVTIVVVALPEIQSGLHATFADVQWVIDAYALTLAAVLLTSGTLADRYGRRLLFTIGLVLFTIGSLLCGLAQTPLMLILSRSGQGIGGATLYATALALLAQTFRGRERGIAFGVWGAVIGIATSLGPILGGVLTSGISWRAIFLVNVPIGIAAVLVTRVKVDESRMAEVPPLDWAGFVTLTAGLVGLVYGLIRAGEIAWSDEGVAISLALAAVFLIAFLVVEARVEHPMFDLSLFRVPTFVGGSFAALAMNGSLFALFVYLVIYLQDDLGYSALGTGVRLLFVSGSTLVAATLAGRASAYVPVRLLIGPGLAIVGIGLILMGGLDATSSWTHLIPGFVLGGIGTGLVNPPLASTAVGVVEPQRAGMASGVNTTFRQIAIATSIAALGSIFSATLERHLREALAAIPPLAGRASEVTTALKQGQFSHTIAAAPASERRALVGAVRTSFAGTMNDLFVVTGVIALVGAVLAFSLIRQRDFHAARGEAL